MRAGGQTDRVVHTINRVVGDYGAIGVAGPLCSQRGCVERTSETCLSAFHAPYSSWGRCLPTQQKPGFFTKLSLLLSSSRRFLHDDHTALPLREYERRIGVIESVLQDIHNLKTERIVPPIANHVPHILVFWDETRVKITREQVTARLAHGDPSISLGRVRGTGDQGLLVSVFMLKLGEVEIVAGRLNVVLKQAVR